MCTVLPCVLAGMQRGSSPRSHHSGGGLGSSLVASTDSRHDSTEIERSHVQSAALAGGAGSKSSVATASAGKRFLIEADPNVQSNALGWGRKKRRRKAGEVKPLSSVGGWERREYRLVGGFTPASSSCKRVRVRVYSTKDVGIATASGNPGIFSQSTSSSALSSEIRDSAWPT